MNDARKKLELPDRRKHTYAALEKKIDDHAHEIEDRFHHWFVRGLIAFAVIGLTSGTALIGFGVVLHNERQRAVELCEATNIRHDNAIKALKAGSDEDIKNATTPAAKTEIGRRRDVTIGLIDASTPFTPDCHHPPKPPKPIELPKKGP